MRLFYIPQVGSRLLLSLSESLLPLSEKDWSRVEFQASNFLQTRYSYSFQTKTWYFQIGSHHLLIFPFKSSVLNWQFWWCRKPVISFLGMFWALSCVFMEDSLLLEMGWWCCFKVYYIQTLLSFWWISWRSVFDICVFSLSGKTEASSMKL